MAIANTVIQIKKSTATGNVPVSLANGELAINAADGKLFYKDTTGTIKNITNQLTFGTVNSNGSLIIASTTTDTLSIIPGNNVTITTNTISKTIRINSSAAGAGYRANNLIFSNSTGQLSNTTNLLYFASNNSLFVYGGTVSTNTITGALVVQGGVGISGNLNARSTTVTGNIYIAGSANTIVFGDGTTQNSAAQVTPYTGFDGVFNLDDLSYVTDGLRNTFTLTYNSSNVTVTSPNQLVVSVDGALQPTFVYNSDTVWLSQVFGGYKGYTIDYEGQLRFSDAPPSGAQIDARTVVGAITTTKKVYPFSPIDIMMGY
jgi:hypothetical protein